MIKLVYYEGSGGGRVQNLDADGYIVHGDLDIPDQPIKYTYVLPPMSYQDSSVDLSFNQVLGSNAVVSEIRLEKKPLAKPVVAPLVL